MYDTDRQGLIVNGPSTFQTVAADLYDGGRMVLNWTDQEGTVYNVLLALQPPRIGTLSGVIDGVPAKLWVGVAGVGCSAFNVGSFLAPGYVAEKIGTRSAVTSQALAELLSGVSAALADNYWARQ